MNNFLKCVFFVMLSMLFVFLWMVGDVYLSVEDDQERDAYSGVQESVKAEYSFGEEILVSSDKGNVVLVPGFGVVSIKAETDNLGESIVDTFRSTQFFLSATQSAEIPSLVTVRYNLPMLVSQSGDANAQADVLVRNVLDVFGFTLNAKSKQKR